MLNSINVLSLFDGISCGRVALENAGIKIKKYYASEIDKYAEAVSKYQYSDTVRLGDVCKWRNWEIETPDIIMGGSPCQNLSIAGDRKGLTGDKSILFFEFCKILEYYNPKWFIFENVASMNVKDKEIITSRLKVEPIIINSSLVSAQQRKRLYWTNIEGIQQPQDKGFVLRDFLEWNAEGSSKAYTLTATYGNSVPSDMLKYKRTQVFEPISVGSINDTAAHAKVYSIQGKSVSLNANGANAGLYKIDLPDGDYYIRKLTPLECERLQTIPDNYTEYGDIDGKIKKISDAQRYKMIGNGWTVDVISHILSYLQE